MSGAVLYYDSPRVWHEKLKTVTAKLDGKVNVLDQKINAMNQKFTFYFVVMVFVVILLSVLLGAYITALDHKSEIRIFERKNLKQTEMKNITRDYRKDAVNNAIMEQLAEFVEDLGAPYRDEIVKLEERIWALERDKTKREKKRHESVEESV